MTDSSAIDPLRSALFTDLYELTMAQAYDAEHMDQTAVFELTFRTMPAERNFFVAAGLDDVLASLENLHFTDNDVAWLGHQSLFTERFLQRLKHLRFRGDVYAMPEGTPVFPGEPLIQIVAPMAEAQIIETLVLNQIHFQTVAATKASRVVLAAAGRNVVDFGSRRAHGADAALKVARTSYLAGAAGTSNVLAGRIYGIPIFGTMAHSYILAHDDESHAFAEFSRPFPKTTLLVDTYDTLNGVQNVIELSRKMGARFQVAAIRLDSGNVGELAGKSRQMLDAAGLNSVHIFATGGLDEHSIAALIAEEAPIDGFGVGTRLAVSDDVPALDMVYKLVEYAGLPRMKLSENKIVLPGRKQVFRQVERGLMVRDIVGRYDDQLPGEPILQPVMIKGTRVDAGRVTLVEARTHTQKELSRLPGSLVRLESTHIRYPVEFSETLVRDCEMYQQLLRESQLPPPS